VYIWCGALQISTIFGTLKQSGLVALRIGVWNKSNPSPMNGQYSWLSANEFCVYGRHKNAYFDRPCKGALWQGPVVQHKVHPTQKPVWLMQELITASVPPRGKVLDPCMGSGTTGVAAKLIEREFDGYELHQPWYQLAVRRIGETVAP
jgi:DNA modification methylase